MKKIDKKQFKLTEGKCRICKEPFYATLDVHRMIPGSAGGKYTKDNVVCICANCHRKVHENIIVIDRWYNSTNGRILRIEENGIERFV